MHLLDLNNLNKKEDAYVALTSFDTNEKSKALTIFNINLQIL
jgi:hypothetical protein